MRKIQPLGNRLLVKQSESEAIGGGIVLPASMEQEKKAFGKVIAMGNGPELKELGLKKGDLAIFGVFAGETVVLDDIEYKLLNHDDILAKII